MGMPTGPNDGAVAGWDGTGLPPDIDSSWPVPDIGISAAFDFPRRTRPTAFYLIASTPRCGGTYLSHRLWSTGAMGAPIEYFGYEYTMPQMIVRLGVGGLLDYVDRILERRTSPNGIFGFHIHWHNFVFAATSGAFVRMPGLRVIHIERTDRLAQAVSHVKALQTGQWAAGHRAAGSPVYDRAAIARSLDLIALQTAEWQATFKRNRVDPISVTYEGLCADPDAVVADILRRFGATPDPTWRPPLPPIARQADHVNRDWIERFRRETGS
jgi:trehalose 2-sulfotransferase